MSQIPSPGHKRTGYQISQPATLRETAKPSTQSKKIQEPTEPTLLQKIGRAFCCCCFKPEPNTHAKEINFDDLLFDIEGSGEQRHYVMHASACQFSLSEPQEGPEETLYSRLNQLDYAEVRNVIEANKELLSEEKRTRLLEILEEMQKSEPFLHPNKLAQKISDLPDRLFREIQEQASLAVINESGKKLASINIGSAADPLKNLITALDICYVFPGREECRRQTGRYPMSLQEKAACIRWGALHRYHPDFMPESIYKLKTETEETVLDHKNSTTEELSPRSTSTSLPCSIKNDSSLETLVGEGLDSQFNYNATTLTILRDVP